MDDRPLIVRGSVVKLKQGGQIAGVPTPAVVRSVIEMNAVFINCADHVQQVPLAWLEVVK